MKKTSFKIGAVSYHNTLPLTHCLARPFETAPPSDLVQKVLNDELDIALLPVYSILKHNLQAYPQAGLIGCDGPVQSVAFFTRPHIQSLADIQSLYLDTESRSGVHLAQIVLKRFFGRNLKSIQDVPLNQCHKADAQVLIGDKALFFKEPGFQRFDLGELWKKYTGFGFVFACWASKKALPNSILEELAAAKTQGLQKIDDVLEQNTPNSELVLNYLKHAIVYELNDSLKMGLREYEKILREENFFSEKKELNTFYKQISNYEEEPVFTSQT